MLASSSIMELKPARICFQNHNQTHSNMSDWDYLPKHTSVPANSCTGPPAVPVNTMSMEDAQGQGGLRGVAHPEDQTMSKGDGFCRGFCAGLCCYCCLDMCF
ncbi:uncharacterized protein LOC125316035 [Rhodamnia argentea]|uniref:Uncharacterized protein LOC125316035 n=1 Tax=Rhodamnia argentea TaxID=178133 RepID=A0ABM3HQB4_9MYRT|nr:uncharacterized protein LOC125316035 [Rhodamnia argentea]